MVYEVKRQKRVIATDRNDKYVSIPLNYKMPFQVLEPGKREYILLSIHSRQLPLRFTRLFTVELNDSGLHAIHYCLNKDLFKF